MSNSGGYRPNSTVLEDSPQLSAPPPVPAADLSHDLDPASYDIEADPDDRLQPVRTDAIGGVLTLQYPDDVTNQGDDGGGGYAGDYWNTPHPADADTSPYHLRYSPDDHNRTADSRDYDLREASGPDRGNNNGDPSDSEEGFPSPPRDASFAMSVDDSFVSVGMGDEGGGEEEGQRGRIREDLPDVAMSRLRGLTGMDNEAYDYDGDADTDLSHSFHTTPSDLDAPVVLRNPDPFPILDRPVSGRYMKNPSLERKKKSLVLSGPYDPNIGVFLSPPVTTKKDPAPERTTRVRKRIPRPPSRLQMRCAYLWAWLACVIGNFLCAIPALRYVCIANESRRIGDFNSAHSYLRKTAILAAVAIVLAVTAWTVLILYLSGSL